MDLKKKREKNKRFQLSIMSIHLILILLHISILNDKELGFGVDSEEKKEEGKMERTFG